MSLAVVVFDSRARIVGGYGPFETAEDAARCADAYHADDDRVSTHAIDADGNEVELRAPVNLTTVVTLEAWDG